MPTLRLMTLKPEPQALDPAATCLLGLRLGFNPEALKPAPKTVNKWKLKKANLVRSRSGREDLHPLARETMHDIAGLGPNDLKGYGSFRK